MRHNNAADAEDASDALAALLAEVRACRLCALPAGPRPIVEMSGTARLLIIGQAPGTRVHASGAAWDDASGDRLREWTGLPRAVFYDTARVAQVPMGLCYPGKGASGDLPPRRECAPLWHDRLLAQLPADRLTLLVGAHAQKRYMGGAGNMTARVRDFRAAPAGLFPLPHPSWRSTGWMRRNPWFEAEVLPELRSAVAVAIRGADFPAGPR